MRSPRADRSGQRSDRIQHFGLDASSIQAQIPKPTNTTRPSFGGCQSTHKSGLTNCSNAEQRSKATSTRSSLSCRAWKLKSSLRARISGDLSARQDLVLGPPSQVSWPLLSPWGGHCLRQSSLPFTRRWKFTKQPPTTRDSGRLNNASRSFSNSRWTLDVNWKLSSASWIRGCRRAVTKPACWPSCTAAGAERIRRLQRVTPPAVTTLPALAHRQPETRGRPRGRDRGQRRGGGVEVEPRSLLHFRRSLRSLWTFGCFRGLLGLQLLGGGAAVEGQREPLMVVATAPVRPVARRPRRASRSRAGSRTPPGRAGDCARLSRSAAAGAV